MAFDKLEITARYLVNSDEPQIKVVQGTKPREGGRLKGFKIDKIIAATRHTISQHYAHLPAATSRHLLD